MIVVINLFFWKGYISKLIKKKLLTKTKAYVFYENLVEYIYVITKYHSIIFVKM